MEEPAPPTAAPPGRSVKFATAPAVADDNDNSDNDSSKGMRREEARSFRPGLSRNDEHTSTWHLMEEETRRFCFPDGFHYYTIPLVVSIIALAMTAAGSWHCSYFTGATIAFTGKHFGLWTLEDSSGDCQLWDVLFFAYDLGAPLISARIFSMTAMLIGLGLCATMAQASQFHIASWGIGVCLFILFVISVSTSDRFNVWAIFWLLTYIIMVLLVRYLFVHPVPRRISKRGSKIIASFFLICATCCFLTLVVLKSDYCSCAGLTAERLEGRDPGDPCDGSCSLSHAGYMIIVGGVFWIAAAVCCLKFGLQPDVLKENMRRSREDYAHYPTKSIVTRTVMGVKSLAGSSHSQEPSSSLHDSKKAAADASNGDLDATGEDKEDGSNERSMKTTDNEFDDEDDVDQAATNDEEDPKLVDKRSCMQKWCCDYRVTARSRKQQLFFWTFRTVLFFVMLLYFFFNFLLIGSRIENTTAAERPSTTKYFTTKQVCAFDPNDPFNPFKTFDTKEEALLANWTIAHCGNCGECSNPQDIVAYVETRKTIAKKSKACGPNVFLGTKDDVTECLQSKIGFTRPCTECWSSNMINTGKRCLATCMRTLFSGFMTDNNVPGAGDQGWLNQCLFCDEKMSGPAFVTCSGVARRRLGIVSEIERNPEEQCGNVEIDWVGLYENNDFDSIGFDRTRWENE